MDTISLGSRKIRVFLSSTFQDLQTERDYLVKHIFPAFKAIADKRNVDFSVIDLRWGVTEKEVRDGKTIEVCLNAVDETRPYFIGLIGNRYGYCPELKEIKNSKRLLNLHPWVADCLNNRMSITEMEIRYGAFLKADNILSHFYIKNRTRHSDESLEKKTRLSTLRKMIEKKAEEGLCGVSHYTSAKKLGTKVYADLLRLLDELYPESQTSAGYILAERQKYLVSQYQKIYFNDLAIDDLEEAVCARRSKKWCLVLNNKERGIGKTALICNWRKEDPHVVRTLLNELNNTSQDALMHFRYELSNRHLEASDVIWIIDGIDYLHTYSDCNLYWLASPELQNTRIIITTHSDYMENKVKYFAQNEKRTCIIHDNTSLRVYTERIKIIKAYLNLFAKKLTQDQYHKIQEDSKFGNTGVLKVFLQELLQFGRDGKELSAFMKPYFTKGSLSPIYDFFDVVIKRLEQDYGSDIVNTYFGLLSITNYGIPAAKMQQLLHMGTLQWETFGQSVKLLSNQNVERISLHPCIKENFALISQKNIEGHKMLIPIFDELYKQKEKTPDASLLDIELLQVERVLHYFKSGQEEKLFKKLGLPRLVQLIRHNDEVSYALEHYINHSGRKINKLLPLSVIPDMGDATIVAICKHFLQSNEKEITCVKKHIINSSIDVGSKANLIAKIDSLMADEHTNIEEQWLTRPLSDINVYELLFFAQYEVMYIGYTDRIANIGIQADKLLKRYRTCQQTEDVKIALTALYAIMCYCFHEQRNYRQSFICLDNALQLNPTNEKFYILRLLSYIDQKSEIASLEAFRMINSLHLDAITLNKTIRQAANSRLFPLVYLYRAGFGHVKLVDKYDFETDSNYLLSPRLLHAFVSSFLDRSMLYSIRMKTALLLDYEGYEHEAAKMYMDSFYYAHNNTERMNSIQLADTQLLIKQNEDNVAQRIQIAAIACLMGMDKLKPISDEKWHSSMAYRRLSYLIKRYDVFGQAPYVIPYVQKIAEMTKHNIWRPHAIAALLLHTSRRDTDDLYRNIYLKAAKSILQDTAIYDNKEPLRAVMQCCFKVKKSPS